MNHRKVWLFCSCSMLGIFLFWALPLGACKLYPWWIPIGMFCLFSYFYGIYYFFRDSSIQKLCLGMRIFLCILDIFLFIPAAFLVFVFWVKFGGYDIPIIFERKAMSAKQMLVVSNNLYTIFAQETKLPILSSANPSRDFDNFKSTLLFQLRLLKRGHLEDSQIFLNLNNAEKKIQEWEYPKTLEDKKNLTNEFKITLENLTIFFAQLTDKKLSWNWSNKKKLLFQSLLQIEEFPLFTTPEEKSNQKKIPIPELYWSSDDMIKIYWQDQDRNLEICLNLNEKKQKGFLKEYHSITLKFLANSPTFSLYHYQFELQRYPKSGNTFLEEGIKKHLEISVQPKEIAPLSFYTQYNSFFHRLNLLGTTHGIRNQDIFFRFVSAFDQIYMRWSVFWVILVLLILGSLPILNLSQSAPKYLLNAIKYIFQLLQHSTGIPIYIIISIIFIGLYDGKNFTALFICVGYFLLPSFYSEMDFQVSKYQQTFLLAKRSLGFSDKTIFYHFIFRESIALYLNYSLYFCATMILFETSFAYLKGGAPSELSLGIFLYLNQNNWTTETYSCIIVVVSTIYFFCRMASHFQTKKNF